MALSSSGTTAAAPPTRAEGRANPLAQLQSVGPVSGRELRTDVMGIYITYSTVESTVKGYVCIEVSTVVGKKSLSLVITLSRCKYSSYVFTFLGTYPHSARTSKTSVQFPEHV